MPDDLSPKPPGFPALTIGVVFVIGALLVWVLAAAGLVIGILRLLGVNAA